MGCGGKTCRIRRRQDEGKPDILAKKLYLVNNAPNEAKEEKYVLQQLLGIDTSKGAFNVADNIIQAYESKVTDPQLKSRMGKLFGLDEDSVRFMRKGADFVLEKLDEVKRKGYEQSDGALKQAEDQKVALGGLALAWEKVYNAISRAVSPSVTAAAKEMKSALEGTGIGDKKSPMPNVANDNNSILRGLAIVADANYGGFMSTDKPPAGRTSTLSGKFGDSDGGGPVKSSGSALQRQLEALEDFNSPGTKYSSDAVRRRVAENGGLPSSEYRSDSNSTAVQVEVTFTNAPPGTAAKATAGGASMPVRVFHSNIAGSTP